MLFRKLVPDDYVHPGGGFIYVTSNSPLNLVHSRAVSPQSCYHKKRKNNNILKKPLIRKRFEDKEIKSYWDDNPECSSVNERHRLQGLM